MARKFKCFHCNEEIIVKYLWPGEDANCQACGKENTVPEDFETVPDEEYDKLQESKTPASITKPEENPDQHVMPVTVTNVSMTFGAMVVFMIKWALAAIPAMIILYIIGMLIIAIFAGFAVS